ncbi:hypothetical protein [Burkholderia pseudomallei]|uniref:hypothetical protein n=1 Tax=Burkholderia pseudomallei TaxID=28450 RepID=UPI000531D1BB|nr:hypothetical protein [Burkholderia pseudomallei]KGS46143.1 hypothetical protein X992_3347 [Burkholderia pseudomallei MSHR5492]KGS79460.1 hypothetical protein X947_4356 [Burkholderia pseudomallei MSHR7334]KGU89809.1 hypothetical protein X880_4203 [Burkholderia pseudomallei MSHR4032]KGW63126.1 hypothetical protein Y039_2085 [Burkholderia pseudomallei MSHR1029]ONC25437.1 hypothetical protein AQ913_04105 [Burkholderia pseudomallei]
MKRATSLAFAALFALAASSAFAHGMPERVFKERKPIRADARQEPSQRDASSAGCASGCPAGAALSRQGGRAPGASPSSVGVEAAAGVHPAVNGG